MKKKLYRFLHWLYNKLHKPKYRITARGLYLCHYIIEKYINETRDDFNQNYEEMIDKSLAKIEKTSFFTSFKDNDGNIVEISPADRRSFAAAMVITSMLYSCGNEDKEQVYSYIENKNVLELIKGCIEKGLVF